MTPFREKDKSVAPVPQLTLQVRPCIGPGSPPGSSMHSPILLDGLEEIRGRFDGLIVDQWGVLHDGSALIPAAVEALRRLREHGKRVVLLSNTGRRLTFNLERLRALGLDDGLVDGVVTSGETAWQMLRDGDGVFGGFGR
ncbi:MAG: hypothetical protein R3349_11700, partial [Geminicoccaceae bacterium]|nr:hypothetical protein [Geminicoccaceae bacterium]